MRVSKERLQELLDYNPATGLFTWKRHVAGTVRAGSRAGSDNKGYILIKVDKKRHPAHCLAWEYMYGEIPKEMEIDHINGIRNDNRIVNLRCISASGNAQNQRRAHKDNSSGFLGTFPYGNRFRAQIYIDRKQKYLGTFDTPEEAHEAYLVAKRLLHEGNTL